MGCLGEKCVMNIFWSSPGLVYLISGCGAKLLMGGFWSECDMWFHMLDFVSAWSSMAAKSWMSRLVLNGGGLCMRARVCVCEERG